MNLQDIMTTFVMLLVITLLSLLVVVLGVLIGVWFKTRKRFRTIEKKFRTLTLSGNRPVLLNNGPFEPQGQLTIQEIAEIRQHLRTCKERGKCS